MLDILLTFVVLLSFFYILYIFYSHLKKEKQEYAARQVEDRAHINIELERFVYNFGEEDENRENRENEATPRTEVDVHDRDVQDSIKTSFSKLNSWYQELQEKNALDKNLNMLKREIFNCKDLEKVEKAYNVLRTIIVNNQYISSISMGELDVLNIVFERCQHKDNDNIQLVENLISQLADSGISGTFNSRCAIGRVSRIIQTLEGGDFENIVNISCYENIKNELAIKIAHLRDKNEDSLTIEELRGTIDAELRKDYVESGILSQDKYKDFVKVYLEAIE